MTREFDEPVGKDAEDDADDTDLVGGGGPASAIEYFEGDEEELDAHGDNLSRVDEGNQ